MRNSRLSEKQDSRGQTGKGRESSIYKRGGIFRYRKITLKAAFTNSKAASRAAARSPWGDTAENYTDRPDRI